MGPDNVEGRIAPLWPVILPALAGAVFIVTQHPVRAMACATMGSLLLVLMAQGVDVQGAIGRAVGAVVHVVSAVAASVLFVATILPAWLLARISRRDVLRGRGRPASNWRTPAGDAAPGSLADARPVASRRSFVGRMAWVVGVVMILLGANYGVGWVLDEALGRSGPESLPDLPASEQASTADVTRDPRIDEPAMAAYPWRERYFADLQRTPGTYWPYTESRPLPFSSPYVNVDGWDRRSYQPRPKPGIRPLRVWFFGGSTGFGEGQRDEYTIPSWVARLSEQDGMPVEITNYGQRGWTHFQEMILYEQLLASEEPPDVAIFYDGANEANAQSLLNEAVPTHVLALTYAEKLSGGVATRFVQTEPEDTDVVGDLWHAYSEHSFVHKVARRLPFGATPAGAAPVQNDDDEPGEEFTEQQQDDPADGMYEYRTTPQDIEDAIEVYERGRRFTLQLSEEHEVESILIWQPMRGTPPDGDISPPTVDLREVLLEHQDIFIDGGHTNEEGARIVAEALWEQLRPIAEDHYQER